MNFFCSEGCGKSCKNDSFFSRLPISHPHPMPKAPWSGFFISIKEVVVIVPHTRWLLLEMTREIALHIRPLCQVQWSKNKEMFTLHKPAQYHHLCIFWGFLCPPPALTASEHLHATGSLKGAPENRILFWDFFYFMPFFLFLWASLFTCSYLQAKAVYLLVCLPELHPYSSGHGPLLGKAREAISNQ